MGEAVQALSALFVELEDINKLLNDYEKSRNNKALSQAAVKIKTGAPKLKEILANPSYKNADTAPLMQQLKNGFRDAFARAKALKDGGKSAEGEDEEAPLPSSPSKKTVNGSPSTRSKDRERDRDRDRDRDREREREREREKRKGDSERDGADEDDEERKRKEQEAAREKERERRKREEEREKEKQRRDAKRRQDEEEESRKNVEQERAKEEEKRKEEIAKKQFEEEEAKDKEFRRQAYLKKKEEDAKRAEQAKRIMENGEDADEIETTDLRAKFKGKDIWSSILKDHEVKSQAEYGEGKFGDSDYTLIFVGSKNSGKSTLLGRFLEKSGEPKPSTALEYSYGRHAKVSTGVAKDSIEIVHTWELAGGTSLKSLFDVSLSVDSFQNAVVVIVLDLSEPSTIMETLLKWQETIRNRAEECLAKIEKTNPLLAEGIRKISQQSYPESHPDRDSVKPIPIPTIIVGTKYDLFQDFEAERRKVCVRTLRYFANTTGSSLIFVTAKDSRDDGSFTKVRALLNYYLFHTPHNRNPVIEYTKPILIPAGADSFEAIGRAPYGPTKTGLAAWKSSFDQVFPPLEEKAQDMGRFEDDFSKFAEPSIDSIRLEKEKELERIRRLRGREQTNNHNVIPPSDPISPSLSRSPSSSSSHLMRNRKKKLTN